MDENKLVKLNIEPKAKNSEAQTEKKPKIGNFLHTNPILEKMFVSNVINEKNKFSIKDLFK